VGNKLFNADGRMYGRKGGSEGRTDGQTDMMKLIVSFRNFAKAPNERKICIIVLNLVKNVVFTSGL